MNLDLKDKRTRSTINRENGGIVGNNPSFPYPYSELQMILECSPGVIYLQKKEERREERVELNNQSNNLLLIFQSNHLIPRSIAFMMWFPPTKKVVGVLIPLISLVATLSPISYSPSLPYNLKKEIKKMIQIIFILVLEIPHLICSFFLLLLILSFLLFFFFWLIGISKEI